MLDTVFDRDGKYKKAFEAFEAQFDNALTTIDNESDKLRMDNLTFFKIYHEQQQLRNIDEWKVSELYCPSDEMRPLELPFFSDNSSVCGVKLPQFDIMSTKSAASVVSLSRTLKQLVIHALNLQKDESLSKAGLQSLLDVFEVLEPELKMAVLA